MVVELAKERGDLQAKQEQLQRAQADLKASIDREAKKRVDELRPTLDAETRAQILIETQDEIIRLRAQANQATLLSERNDKLLEEITKTQTSLSSLELAKKDLEARLETTATERATEMIKTTREAIANDAKLQIDKLRQEHEAQTELLTKRIEDMKRSMDQGSQQLQGEALERNFEQVLAAAFPFDVIENIGAGVKGGDVLHKVRDEFQHVAGTILWEAKNTKGWQAAWIQKIKADRHEAKADIAILATVTMPPNVELFCVIDEVIVCRVDVIPYIAELTRDRLLHVSSVRTTNTAIETKAESVYQYLANGHFQARVKRILEGFLQLKDTLDKEKRATQKRWSHQDKSLESIMTEIMGIKGEALALLGHDYRDDDDEVDALNHEEKLALASAPAED